MTAGIDSFLKGATTALIIWATVLCVSMCGFIWEVTHAVHQAQACVP